MKAIYVASVLVLALLLSHCHSAKKAAAAAPGTAAVTFQQHVLPIIQSSCAPCHIPSKGGNKEALDNYSEARKDIDDILRRIQLNPGERGFMPARHPRLSDSAIAVFSQWKQAGLAEK